MQKKVIIALLILLAIVIGVRIIKKVGSQKTSIVPTSSTSSEMVQVQSGQRSTCTDCGKVITAHTHIETRTVLASEASQYKVMEIGEKCPECLAKEAERQRQDSVSRVTGEWIWQNPLGNIVVKLNPDGTGLWDCPKANVRWQQTSGGFTATANWTESGYSSIKNRQASFSGRIIEDGRKLYVEGFGTFGFGSDQSMVFERLR